MSKNSPVSEPYSKVAGGITATIWKGKSGTGFHANFTTKILKIERSWTFPLSLFEPILDQCSPFYILPENIKKPLVFCFQGLRKDN